METCYKIIGAEIITPPTTLRRSYRNPHISHRTHIYLQALSCFVEAENLERIALSSSLIDTVTRSSNMPLKVGLAIFTDPEDEWVIALTDSDYLTGSTRLYRIYARKNQVWCRKDWEVAGLLSAPRFRGVLHLGTLNVEVSTLHGRMQSVCSSEGRGQPNPTDLPWGRKPWIVRVLLTFNSEYGLQIPRVAPREMPFFIEGRIRMFIPSMPLLPMIPFDHYAASYYAA